ncbi:putative disease resistance RPP13-like protein 1 [Cannabis sativa]|uniref:putative disease resistance RPP13-like protein 1 n=1 Tax=Cannabis sativa TaxID=3483 RepID=UPI0029C9B5E3|nr:putative disease resistance RPP13-like protein 1 [Cannabis sativa]
MAAELFGGALLSAFLAPLVEKLASEMKDFFKGKDAILKLLKELKTLLSSADLLLIDAEEKLIKDPRVRKWLDDLKDTIYHVDDVVYKIDAEASLKKLKGGGPDESHSSQYKKRLLKVIPTPLTSFDKAIKPEIEETLGKLKRLLDNKELGLKHVKNHKLPERVCAPSLEESDIYGRNREKEEIIKFLLPDETTGAGGKLSVIPIVGMGGIGKTTLAQLVYKDKRVNKMFDRKVWITLGEDKVDCTKVMKLIVEKVTSKTCEIQDPYELQEEVKKVLTGKKFLFVVDDVWDEDRAKWDVLNNCFKWGKHGSKIIVTTRSTVVASIMKTGSTYQLGRINEAAGWRLFAKHASLVVDSNDYLNLKQVGEKIVDKCKGLPLAIKSMGLLLRDKQKKEEWNNILYSDLWELYDRKKVDILPALWLSYFNLRPELKQCFAYCSLFPKDYHFRKGEMVLLWMAEGLLQSTNGKRVEVGEEYFEDLISMSFFQPSNNDEKESTFLMHDLIHDLAIFVSGEFCYMMNNINKCSHKVRHFSFMQYCKEAYKPKEFEGLFKAKCLRTILWDHFSIVVSLKIEQLDKLFPSLRVLSIKDLHISELPDSIGNLKYLRYFKLHSPEIKEIPNTICKLYNLETLLLEECKEVKRLPNDIGNLIKLRHLSVPKINLVEMPLQLGKLQNLQTLNTFVVGNNRDSASIKLLKEFQDLHGTLSIKGLQNVSSLEEVSAAALKNFKFLSHLSLDWYYHHYSELDELHIEREVLSALQPHSNLKELTIETYKGNSFPNWMGDCRCLSNLVRLKISYCRNCSFLPSLGQLPSLKDLWIRACGVVRIDSEFYCSTTLDSSSSVAIQTKPLFFRSLETLAFIGFYELEEWSFIEGGGFPRLKNLQLIRCERLKVTLLGDYFPSLTELEIHDCEQLIPLLLPRARLMQAPLITLKKIRFKGCPNLTHLDEEAFQHLTSLKELRIEWCCNLQCLPKGLPTSLSDLHIIECPLLAPGVKRETGEDWPIIAHIPNITVDDRVARI